MNRTCRFCGTPLEGYETFCPGCGRELTPDSGTGFRPEIDSAEDTFSPSARAADDWFMEDANPEDDRQSEAVREDHRPEAHGANGRRATPDEGDALRRHAAPRRSSGRPGAAVHGARPNGARGRSEPTHRSGARGRRSSAPSRQTARPGAGSSVQLNPKQRMILLGALAVAAVLLIALSVRLLSGGGSPQPTYEFSALLDTYFESVRTADANKFISTRPPEYVTYLTTGTGGAYPTAAVYRSETANKLQARLDGYTAEYGEVRVIRYRVDEVNSYVHRCEALSGVLTSWYGFRENEVADAVTVSGAYTVQGTKATGEFEFQDLLLIRIGDTWYFSPDAGSYWKAE